MSVVPDATCGVRRISDDEAIDYQVTQKGEPFRGHDVSLNSLSDLIVKLAGPWS